MKFIDIVFDGPPGPEGPRLIEVEDDTGHSINAGEWLEDLQGFHRLRIKRSVDFNELLLTQQLLQDAMGHPTGHGEAGCKENLLQAIVEVVEAMREINFKPWKVNPIVVDRLKLATELTDILQFWANAANAMGLTADDLTEALRAKWVVNHERIKNNEATSALNAVKLNKICLQCGAKGGVHEENCPQNFDADALRDGFLKRVKP